MSNAEDDYESISDDRIAYVRFLAIVLIIPRIIPALTNFLLYFHSFSFKDAIVISKFGRTFTEGEQEKIGRIFTEGQLTRRR
jgi:hypothetical protein